MNPVWGTPGFPPSLKWRNWGSELECGAALSPRLRPIRRDPCAHAFPLPLSLSPLPPQNATRCAAGRRFGSSDTVHFDYVRGGTDVRARNLMAFQRLWNRHNPGRRIDEDGIYGPATENAFANTPCGGW